MPVLRDFINICLKGVIIDGKIFFKRLVEIPDMSGVLLSSSFFMQEMISSSVKGCEKKSNLGKVAGLVKLAGWLGNSEAG